MPHPVLALSAALLAQAGAAAAQPAADTARYDKAPWWMDKPIIAASGHVRTEVAANRADFEATYQVVDRDPAAATKAAADKVRALGAALSAYGPERVRVETTFDITPLYEQYRDKSGELQDNERSDKIKTYQVSAHVSVELRDVRLAEKVYATALAAKPSRTGAVTFRLEPDNEMRTQLFKAAVEDAARRGRLATEAAGAKLGAVRLIDPTGRACQTDVLVAGAPRSYGEPGYARQVAMAPPAPPPGASLEEIVTTGAKRAAEVGLRPEDLQLPLQPPLQSLEASACVVFALS